MLNGDFELAGDDPTDVPFWTYHDGRVGLRGDRLDSGGDAALVLMAPTTAHTEYTFPVTTGESINFTLGVHVLAGRARALLELYDGQGRIVVMRQYDVGRTEGWTTFGVGAPIAVVGGADSGRVILASYAEPIVPGAPIPPRAAAVAMFDNVVVGK